MPLPAVKSRSRSKMTKIQRQRSELGKKTKMKGRSRIKKTAARRSRRIKRSKKVKRNSKHIYLISRRPKKHIKIGGADAEPGSAAVAATDETKQALAQGVSLQTEAAAATAALTAEELGTIEDVTRDKLVAIFNAPEKYVHQGTLMTDLYKALGGKVGTEETGTPAETVTDIASFPGPGLMFQCIVGLYDQWLSRWREAINILQKQHDGRLPVPLRQVGREGVKVAEIVWEAGGTLPVLRDVDPSITNKLKERFTELTRGATEKVTEKMLEINGDMKKWTWENLLEVMAKFEYELSLIAGHRRHVDLSPGWKTELRAASATLKAEGDEGDESGDPHDEFSDFSRNY